MRGSETDNRIVVRANFTKQGGMGEVGNANEVESGDRVSPQEGVASNLKYFEKPIDYKNRSRLHPNGVERVKSVGEVGFAGGTIICSQWQKSPQVATQRTTQETTQETTQQTTRQTVSSRVWEMGESRDGKCGKRTADGAFRLHGRDRNRSKSRDRNRIGGKRFGRWVVCGKAPVT